MKVLIAIAVALAAVSAQAQDAKVERRTTTSIGEVRTAAGKIQLDVVAEGTSKRVVVFVSDRHVIRTGLLMLNKAELEGLRSLVDEAMRELEPPAPSAGASAPR